MTVDAVNMFTCDVCRKIFSRKDNLGRHMRTHKPVEWKCIECNQTFQSERRYRQHRQIVHGEIDSSTEYYECNECRRKLASRRTLLQHIKSHGRNNRIRKASQLKCLNCNAVFQCREVLIDHYNEAHNIQLQYERLTFESVKEFEDWMSPCYYLETTWVTADHIVRRFHCHRSGYYEDACKKKNKKRQRYLKLAGSKKLQGFCPGEVTLRENPRDGRCLVTHQTRHIGHDIRSEQEAQHIYLKDKKKTSIVYELKADVSQDTNLHNVYQEYESEKIKTLSSDLHCIREYLNFSTNRQDIKCIRPKVTKKLRLLRQRHSIMEKYEDEGHQLTINIIDDGTWQVGSFRETSELITEMYTIQKVDPKECTLYSENCGLVCEPCKSCFHEYQCSCHDNAIGKNMCKHIHALCQFLQRTNFVEVTMINVPEVEKIEDMRLDVSEEADYYCSPTQNDQVYYNHPSISNDSNSDGGGFEGSDNVYERIEQMCDDLKNVLKSNLHDGDISILNAIEQKFLVPIEPTILALKKRSLESNDLEKDFL